MTTIRDALQSARTRLKVVSDTASLDAQAALGEVLDVERAYLLAHPEHALTPEQEQRYTALVDRLADGEPLAYVLGRRAFYDREFIVTPAVLIPRPETELLLGQALSFVRQHPDAAVVDVGTGSGALAVTLAALCPLAKVYATDISPAALDVARRNTRLHGVEERVMLLEGSLLHPLMECGVKVDVVMANLPYIASNELAALEVSRHEPRLALDGGIEGLVFIRELISQIPDACNPGGLALLEIGATQGSAVLNLAHRMLSPSSAEVLKDYAGLDRILSVRGSGEPLTDTGQIVVMDK